MFNVLVAVVASLAAGIASVAGFGIGSLLTPLLASRYGMKTAVGAVAIPHLIATVLRFWRLRSEVDRLIFFGFGYADRMRFSRRTAWIAGILSGAFGGLVGNQEEYAPLRCWAWEFRDRHSWPPQPRSVLR